MEDKELQQKVIQYMQSGLSAIQIVGKLRDEGTVVPYITVASIVANQTRKES